MVRTVEMEKEDEGYFNVQSTFRGLIFTLWERSKCFIEGLSIEGACGIG